LRRLAPGACGLNPREWPHRPVGVRFSPSLPRCFGIFPVFGAGRDVAFRTPAAARAGACAL